MDNKSSHRGIFGYVIVFIAFLLFAGLTFFNGQRINSVTQTLVEKKLPGLVAIADLKNNIQSQQITLYQLYATADTEQFQKTYKQESLITMGLLDTVNMLPQYQEYESQIAELLANQSQYATTFVDEMNQPSIHWDNARKALANFNMAVSDTSDKLNILSIEAQQATLDQAALSQDLIDQLIKASFIIASLILIGIFILAWL